MSWRFRVHVDLPRVYETGTGCCRGAGGGGVAIPARVSDVAGAQSRRRKVRDAWGIRQGSSGSGWGQGGCSTGAGTGRQSGRGCHSGSTTARFGGTRDGGHTRAR
jgi:hypothetical protein